MKNIFNGVLLKSVAILIFGILFFRIGSHTPIPFVNKDVFSALFQNNTNGILHMMDVMGGGSLSRMSIFTLGVYPYVTASLIIFWGQMFSKEIKEMSATEVGKIKIERTKRLFTIGLVFVQSATIATVLQSQSLNGHAMTTISGVPFYITTFLSLLAGTFICVWLSTILSFVGFGSGMSLIIMIGILSSLPTNILTIARMVSNGSITVMSVMALLVIVVLSLVCVVLADNASRRIPVMKPDRLAGARASHIDLKANPVGFMPPIFSAIALSLPVSFLQMLGTNAPSFVLEIKNYLSHGSYSYVFLYSLLTFVFAFIMLKATVKTSSMANGFKSQGIVVRGIRAGRDTELYLDKLMTSLTIVAAFYLIVLCSIPEVVNLFLGIPLYLGGTSILIMSSTASEAHKCIINMRNSRRYSDMEESIYIK
ncbi:preprotein translocase subunit SecY [Photobacterium damselae]|uniref:preprotein translocase subunit SecY n=1 Tax=Photobacterium damselae TaxID=38293 RepID=UPI0040684D43